MNPLDRRQAISDALKAFASAPLREASLNLFKTMGYKSEKTFDLSPNSPRAIPHLLSLCLRFA